MNLRIAGTAPCARRAAKLLGRFRRGEQVQGGTSAQAEISRVLHRARDAA